MQATRHTAESILPSSTRSYDKRCLPDGPVSLVPPDIGDAPKASEALGRRRFSGGAFCWFSPKLIVPFDN